jgi:hypothetical protein
VLHVPPISCCLNCSRLIMHFLHPSVPSQRYMYSKKTRLKQTARVRCAVSRVSRQRGKLLRTVSNVCEITSHRAHAYVQTSEVSSLLIHVQNSCHVNFHRFITRATQYQHDVTEWAREPGFA